MTSLAEWSIFEINGGKGIKVEAQRLRPFFAFLYCELRYFQYTLPIAVLPNLRLSLINKYPADMGK